MRLYRRACRFSGVKACFGHQAIYATVSLTKNTELYSSLTLHTVVQGVREIYEIKPIAQNSEPPKLVLIGRNLPADLAKRFLSSISALHLT